MEEDRLIQLLTDYIDGTLTDTEVEMVERELSVNPETRKVYDQLLEILTAVRESPELDPRPELQQNFDAFLKGEIAKKPAGKQIAFPSLYFKVAAAVLVIVIAGGIGFYMGGKQTIQPVTDNGSEKILLARLENQYSVSERLIGIQEVYRSAPDDKLVKVLIKLMNEDTNTNVRLAAVNALVRFYDEPMVREALIDALSTQNDPLVQMELIQILVYKKEQEAVKPLENIIKDDQTLQTVKDEAYAGLFSLS